MQIRHHELGRDPLYKIWNTTVGYMIIYTYSEGGAIVFQNRLYPIKKGALCCIGPNVPLYTMPDVPAAYDRSKIYAPKETVQHLLGALPPSSSSRKLFSTQPVVYAQIPPELQGEVEAIYAEAEKSFADGDAEIFLCCFLKLMTYVRKYTAEHAKAPSDSLSCAIDFINRKYAEPITLDVLCNEVHMSKYHLCRKFKETTGMTVMQYILKTRLSAAQSYLVANPALSIGEISEGCGFSSPSYFCQVFKEETGMSPRVYRSMK